MSFQTRIEDWRSMQVSGRNYKEYQRIYDQMKEYSNEDGYCICSLSLIVANEGLVTARAKSTATFFIEIGVLKQHVSKQRRPSGGPAFTVYQLTDKPFTRELFASLLNQEAFGKE